MEDNQNLSPDNDPQLIDALRRLGSNEIQPIDELTRRRHLSRMTVSKVRHQRTRLVGVAAALVLLLGGVLVLPPP